MSEKQRTTEDNPERSRAEGDAENDALASTRAETERLFATASKAFESLAQTDSHEFLRRSRQTGGQ